MYINVEFPSCVAFGAVGSPTWSTSVARNQGGWEQRNQIWGYSLHTYDVSTAIKKASEYKQVLTHFNEVRGRLNTFPFRDPLDNTVVHGEGVAIYVSPGVWQLGKQYGSVNPYVRKIVHTVDAVVSLGSLDVSTGLVTIAASQTRTINSHAVGATHQFTLASALSPNVGIGDLIYPSGITGTAAELLNDSPLEVTAVAGAVVSVDVATGGLTAAGGSVRLFPATSEITWTGGFRVPCRYGLDSLPGQVVNSNGKELFVKASSLILQEVRE